MKIIVGAYEEAAEMQWRQALVQAVLSGNNPDGFDPVARAFRRYRETAVPWLEKLREAEEQYLRERFQEISKHVVQVTVPGGVPRKKRSVFEP